MDYRSIGCTTFIALVLIGVGCYFTYFYKESVQPTESVQPHQRTVSAPTHIDIAATEAAHERGLGGRTTISDDYGMLFIFDTSNLYGFWMKGMLTSIDIMFLADDGTVVSVYENVAPETYPKLFYPKEPVRYVLEVRAGAALTHGYSKGTRITGLPLNIQ